MSAGARPADESLAKSLLARPRLARLLKVLNGDGEETRIVGGAVRNALMGVPVHEIDLATTATPDTIIARAKAAELRSIPTGIDHGTVTILVEGETFEVTTTREDVDTDGRHATVRFGRSFDHDALRRDFTINALSLDADGHIHDYVDGLKDIATRHVRFIGDAEQRIREDYLRILRFFRFHAAYGEGPLDAAAFGAVVRLHEGMAQLSRERVRAELMKLLVARHAASVVRQVAGAGILGPLLGGVPRVPRFERIVELETTRGDAPDPVLRLAALGLFVVEDADRLRELLRLSNAEYERLRRCADATTQLHGRSTPPPHGELRAFLFAHRRTASLDAIRLARVDAGAEPDDAAWNSAFAFLHDTPEPNLPFSGADLLSRGLRPGRAIGETLKLLQAKWIRAGFPKEPEVLARLLDESVAESAAKRE